MSISPTPSVDSADEALLEWLGVHQLTCIDDEEEDERVETKEWQPFFTAVAPPPHCHRPHTPHTPLLRVSCPLLLSKAQCHYILRLGCRATNNGGQSYGPQYVSEAVHPSTTGTTSTLVVQLQAPNHHKVCVFTHPMVSQWIQDALQASGLHREILDWSHANGICDNSAPYRVHPRLRLLRYDARDDDVFLPHYDATTTTTTTHAGHLESKLTLLIYLNTGRGESFLGGQTLFLNAWQPKAGGVVAIEPECGKMVLFNHELCHSSQPLEYNELLRTPSYSNINKLAEYWVPGGTKFVLRTDILFPVMSKIGTTVPEESLLSTLPASGVAVRTVDRVVQELFRDHSASSNEQEEERQQLTTVLQQLDLYHLRVECLLIPGPAAVEKLLTELEIAEKVARDFVGACLVECGRSA